MSKNDYSEADIRTALIAVGLQRGDVVYTQSNIGFFGRAEGAASAEALYKMFKRAMFEVIGSEGTWILPTFTYSFCRKQDFDVAESAGDKGVLSECARKDSDAIRSADANFSVVAIGSRARAFTANMPEYSFGKDSFWDRLYLADGKICNFNLDSASALIHFVERSLHVPYRYDKPFTGIVIDGAKRYSATFYHFVADKNKPESASSYELFDSLAKDSGIAKVANLGRGQIVAISARDTYSLIEKKIQTNPLFLTDGYQEG
ncbi:MAG: hypothetical protein A2898_03180 [Candidatus Kerfeldbacteria bacterium RIFCSPLOWO2_01_FULL_48_11]|uniref:Aminoglycoside N(3)-acetyltransferase n=3 Tax=Parcubacteria group TaxID=1794811 RepID=A0A0G2AFZ1_9BACT|nr:MAG: Aminoglycoside N3'-acetyltransferase [Candidatus Kaiserbacteria bacterium GW2011_GWA2_52_12]KKW31444.1 MAG: Aminoglycoside N3'-acetyltransferase [Candidatus Kaiserbacteria bacterium GW2011_GWC2_52_8b]OGY85079.1 MAG: hypothetical protein A2898_03180 [Candidatus Kerfeldbacteria bacterium RIFCSPLOWO2_01_FULL_48_11]